MNSYTQCRAITVRANDVLLKERCLNFEPPHRTEGTLLSKIRFNGYPKAILDPNHTTPLKIEVRIALEDFNGELDLAKFKMVISEAHHHFTEIKGKGDAAIVEIAFKCKSAQIIIGNDKENEAVTRDL